MHTVPDGIEGWVGLDNWYSRVIILPRTAEWWLTWLSARIKPWVHVCMKCSDVDVLCCARNHWVIRWQNQSSYSQTLLRWIVPLSSMLHSRHCTVTKQPRLHCLDLSTRYAAVCLLSLCGLLYRRYESYQLNDYVCCDYLHCDHK